MNDFNCSILAEYFRNDRIDAIVVCAKSATIEYAIFDMSVIEEYTDFLLIGMYVDDDRMITETHSCLRDAQESMFVHMIS